MGSIQIRGLYAIVDLPHRDGLDPIVVVDAMIEGGASVVQLRSKHAPLDPVVVRALGLRCHAGGVPLIINDELELAEAGELGVAGVHLGQTDLARLGGTPDERRRRRASLREAGLVLGISTHSCAQLRTTCDELDPDYVGFGPVFATGTKANPEPVVGLAGLEAACAASAVPVVAIGGIGLDDALDLARRGAAAIAVIGALTGPSPERIRERALALSRAFAGE
ncbi:Thiamine-phosphate synthase [Enhygromyxa salina]|uniref:Thiamine-phosphate synthase n=1 Tax=Enhygromyxa salina TaxID=215803 RepID=A0A2S9YEM5_9BACT|nr:thiamine phosphate synthase [Enhygromyxa salina]PRQ03567.1 Thiamine-phosphate synthase [Enhygromyxa salina]